MAVTKVTRNFQVTLPPEARRALHAEIGSHIEFMVRRGTVTLRCKQLVDKDQAWFWTREWQKKEQEADEDIEKGRFRNVKSISALKKSLGH